MTALSKYQRLEASALWRDSFHAIYHMRRRTRPEYIGKSLEGILDRLIAT